MGPSEFRLLTSLNPRFPPNFAKAVLTLLVMASRKKPKTLNMVLLPVPLAPTNTQKLGRLLNSTSWNALKFLSRMLSIFMLILLTRFPHPTYTLFSHAVSPHSLVDFVFIEFQKMLHVKCDHAMVINLFLCGVIATTDKRI